MRRLSLTALLLLGCGSDVVVGVNYDDQRSSNPGDSAIRSSLLTIRRAANAHVAGGVRECSDPRDQACEGWLARVTSAPTLDDEARLAGSGPDVVRSLALLGDDRILVGSHTTDGRASAFIARRTSIGPVWETALSADPTRPTEGRAVALAPDGTILVGWNEQQVDGAFRGWIARLTVDGAIDRRMKLGGTPSASETAIDAITTLANGVIYLGGDRNGEPVLVQLSAVFENFGSKTGIGLPSSRGRVKTILGDVDREITACAQVDAGIGVVRLPDSLGDPLATRTLVDPAGTLELGGCAVTDDGSAILLAGTLVRADGVRPWAGRLARQSLDVTWTRTYETEAGARLEAIAPREGSGGMAVGTRDGFAHALRIEP